MPIVQADTPAQQTLSINEMAAGLKSIGLITGDAKGDLMLQSQLKRSQASQFIVNLLGKNQYVKDNKDSYTATSFSDIKAKDWFAASVGFCQQLGIANGYSDGTFKPNGTLSEKEFLSMLIKALGYTGSDEYTWSTVYQKAYELKLVVDSEYQTKTEDNKNFKRADVVKLMYTALNLKPKSEELTLIQKMVDSELITYEKAIASKILRDTTVANISGIKGLNEQKLKVLFNEKISTVKPENIKIYEAANKNNVLTAEITSQTDSELIIKTSKQTPKTKYVMEISKLQDAEKNTIPLATANFTGYVATDVESDLFMIKKVEQKDLDELNVYFTHPINENALNPAFYEVLENESVFASAGAADITVKLLANNEGINITLKGKQFKLEQEYSVRVSSSLISAYGVYALAQKELPSFIAKDKSTQGDEFVVGQVSAISGKTIQVEFSMEPDSERAKDIYQFKLTDSNNNQIQITNSQKSAKSVILTLSKTLDTTKTYTLLIYGMDDSSGQYTIKNQSTSFSGYWVQAEAFEVSSVTPIDTTSIVVTFSKQVDEKSATDVSNYILLDSKNNSNSQKPIKVLYSDKSPCEVKLFFGNDKKMQTDREYTLKVLSKLKDYTGIYLTAQKDTSFDASNLQTIDMQPVSAVLISQDTIKVIFPKEISLENVSTNTYSVEYYDNGTLLKKIPIGIVSIENSTIVLKFDQLVDGVDYTFRYKEIKDFAGNVYSDQTLSFVKVTKGK